MDRLTLRLLIWRVNQRFCNLTSTQNQVTGLLNCTQGYNRAYLQICDNMPHTILLCCLQNFVPKCCRRNSRNSKPATDTGAVWQNRCLVFKISTRLGNTPCSVTGPKTSILFGAWNIPRRRGKTTRNYNMNNTNHNYNAVHENVGTTWSLILV